MYVDVSLSMSLSLSVCPSESQSAWLFVSVRVCLCVSGCVSMSGSLSVCMAMCVSALTLEVAVTSGTRIERVREIVTGIVNTHACTAGIFNQDSFFESSIILCPPRL